MATTWDESKRRANLRRHRLDFAGAEAVFDFPVVAAEDTRSGYGEQRMNLLGWLEGRVVHMTYTERGNDLRIISLRKATKHEASYYFDVVSNPS